MTASAGDATTKPSTHIVTRSEAETSAVGRDLAQTLASGSVVLLEGDLGAGKTAFVRGLAEGLGVDPEDISSPTFTLVQQYGGGRLPLIHVDLYRLDDPREVDDLGLDEIAEGECWRSNGRTSYRGRPATQSSSGCSTARMMCG